MISEHVFKVIYLVYDVLLVDDASVELFVDLQRALDSSF